MKITLIRNQSTAAATNGTVYDEQGKVVCHMLELPWRNNQRRISCIPSGEYDIEFLPKGSPKFPYPCFLLKGVPGRDAIMIHRGNYPKDTLGCLLPGLTAGKDSVAQSTAALEILVKLQPKKIAVKWQNSK